MTCNCSEPVIEKNSRQINEDSRQVTKTCIQCGTVVSNAIVEVRR